MNISSVVNNNVVPNYKQSKAVSNTVKFAPVKDTATFSNVQNNVIDINRVGKNLHVSFTGEFKNPIVKNVPAINFNLSGVMKHQAGTAGGRNAVDDTVVKLAKSDWKEGRELDYSIRIEENEKDGKVYKNKVLAIADKDYGEIGVVPVTLTNKFAKLIESNPAEKDNFKFEITNVNGGVNSAYPTVGIEAAFKYVGKDDAVKTQTQDLFSSLLNSDKKTVASTVAVYEEPTSPKEVLEKIFDIEGQKGGLGRVRQIKTAIDTIAKEINDPKNKNILVLGHCKPDGDTVGCVLGMQAAIKGAFPERNVDMAIDDEIPNNFNKLPGYDNIKRPYNGFGVYQLEKNIELLERNKNSEAAKNQVKMLQSEIERLKDPSKTFDEGAINGKPKKYDLVIMLDTPIPGRTSKSFKKYFETADKTIFIDHHPHRANEWVGETKKLGLDLEKVKKDNLFLVCDSVPAATQIVTAVAEKAGLIGKMFQNSVESAKQFVAGISAGTLTDTCRFDKVASHDKNDFAKPLTERPSYKPEGMTKWLYSELEKAGGNIDKQWMRLNLDYELPNVRIKNADGTYSKGARDLVLEKSVNGRIMDDKVGVGMIIVSADDMKEVYQEAKKQDSKVQMNDVYSAFKSSQALTSLKMPGNVSEEEFKSVKGQAYSTYKSPYDYDRLAVLISQSQKQGELNNQSQIADKNSYSFSFRSGGQSNLAQVAATLFGGGGHAQAAGGGIAMKDLTMDTKLKVMINGKEETDFAKVYAKVTDIIAKKADSSEIKIEKADGEGKTVPELITSITAEVRKTQEPKEVKTTAKAKALKVVA